MQGLTVNQKRLLYMMSLYTHPAETEDDKESWIRQQALMVLIYEGVPPPSSLPPFTPPPARCSWRGALNRYHGKISAQSDAGLGF